MRPAKKVLYTLSFLILAACSKGQTDEQKHQSNLKDLQRKMGVKEQSTQEQQAQAEELRAELGQKMRELQYSVYSGLEIYSTANLEFILIDDQGRKITSHVDSIDNEQTGTPSPGTRIVELTAPASGTYHLQASGSHGSYELHISLIPNAMRGPKPVINMEEPVKIEKSGEIVKWALRLNPDTNPPLVIARE